MADASGIVPDISLGVRPPAAPEGMASNPLAMLGSLANTQNALNQNKLFQQTFEGRQRAGRIIANSPDMDTAITNILKDPVASIGAGETITAFRDAQLALTRQHGEQQKQYTDAWHAVLGSLGPALKDPTQFGPLMDRAMLTLPKANQEAVAPAVASLKKAWAGLSPDQFQRSVVGAMISAGATPEGIRQIIGSPGSNDTGGTTVLGQIDPMTGEMKPAQVIPKTLPPQIITPEVGPGGQKMPMAVGGANGPNGVPVTGPAGPANAMGVPPAPPGPISGPSQAQTSASEASGKVTGEMEGEINTMARQLPSAIKRSDMIIHALQQFQSGGGADWRTAFGKTLQALRNGGISGISQKMVDGVSNGSLAQSELYNAVIKPFVTKQLQADTAGTGRVMLPEVHAYLDSIDQTTDPETILSVMNAYRQQIQVGYDQSQKYLEFKKLLAKRDPSVEGLEKNDFPSWYNQTYKPEGLPQANSAGTTIGQIPATGIKGIEPKVTKRWVPGKGLVPVEGP